MVDRFQQAEYHFKIRYTVYHIHMYTKFKHDLLLKIRTNTTEQKVP